MVGILIKSDGVTCVVRSAGESTCSNFSRDFCPLLHFPHVFFRIQSMQSFKLHEGTVMHIGFWRLPPAALSLIHLFRYNPGVLREPVPRGRVSSCGSWARAPCPAFPAWTSRVVFTLHNILLFFKQFDKDFSESDPLVDRCLEQYLRWEMRDYPSSPRHYWTTESCVHEYWLQSLTYIHLQCLFIYRTLSVFTI